jgi:hypothetical protein
MGPTGTSKAAEIAGNAMLTGGVEGDSERDEAENRRLDQRRGGGR